MQITKFKEIEKIENFKDAKCKQILRNDRYLIEDIFDSQITQIFYKIYVLLNFSIYNYELIKNTHSVTVFSQQNTNSSENVLLLILLY